MIRFAICSLAAAACSRGSATPHLDGSPTPDTRPTTDGPAFDAPVDTATTAYRHTIAIDGSDDFTAGEMFPTTSAGFAARLSWDDQNVYVGYSGPDLDPAAADTATKWMFVYLDTDPGASTGALVSQMYNTQQAVFPAGFGAEYYARWKCDATFVSLEQHQGGGAWATSATVPASAHAGSYIELAIPRAALGGGTKLGIVTWMINEKALAEGSFAGLYAGNFTDGYAASLALTRYLKVDFDATRAPNDAANQAP